MLVEGICDVCEHLISTSPRVGLSLKVEFFDEDETWVLFEAVLAFFCGDTERLRLR